MWAIRPRSVAVAGGISFLAAFSSLAVLQHRAYWTGRFDVGNLVQAVWSTAHGDLLSITSLKGPQISRLGAHFDPIVAALAPLWWLWPDASMLLVVQAAAIAVGAIPVYKLARKHLGSDRGAAGLVLAYLLYPATQWIAVDDFHPVAFATPLLLFAIWFLDEQRLGSFAVVAVLAVLTKEHVGLAVAMLGLWYAIRHRRAVTGVAIAVFAAAVAVVATTVVVPHFAPGGGSPFADRYATVGGSPSGIARTLVSDPDRLFGAVTEGRDLRYLLALLLPLLLVSLLAPSLAAIALPELALNLMSGTATQTSIHFHYTATLIPAFVGAAVFGAARLRSRRLPQRHLSAALVGATLVSGVVLGPLPQWRWVPFGSELATREHVESTRVRAMDRAVALVPDNAAVSATNTLGAHLSERGRIYSFPVILDATWVVVDELRPSHRDNAVAPVRFREALARFKRSSAFRPVFAEQHVLVFRRL